MMETKVAAHLLQLDGAEDDEAQVQFLRVEDGDVLLDEAAAFEALEAFEDGGGGEVHAGGQFFGGQAGVLLQAAQDVQVGGVKDEFVHIVEYYSISCVINWVLFLYCAHFSAKIEIFSKLFKNFG